MHAVSLEMLETFSFSLITKRANASRAADVAKLQESRARLINNQTFLIKSNNQQRSVQCRGRGHSFGAQ